MKSLFSAAILAAGLALIGAGFAEAETSSVGTEPGAVIEHHSTAHSIGMPKPKPRPNDGR